MRGRNVARVLRLKMSASKYMAIWVGVVGGTLLGPMKAEAQSVQTLDLERQVILVTGSTSGLGREVARRLASRGAHVIVHGRNRERGAALIDEIESEGHGSARFFAADFSSFEEVRAFGNSILRGNQALPWMACLPRRGKRGGDGGSEYVRKMSSPKVHYKNIPP